MNSESGAKQGLKMQWIRAFRYGNVRRQAAEFNTATNRIIHSDIQSRTIFKSKIKSARTLRLTLSRTNLRVALGAERAGFEQRLLVVNAPLVHVETRLRRWGFDGKSMPRE